MTGNNTPVKKGTLKPVNNRILIRQKKNPLLAGFRHSKFKCIVEICQYAKFFSLVGSVIRRFYCIKLLNKLTL